MCKTIVQVLLCRANWKSWISSRTSFGFFNGQSLTLMLPYHPVSPLLAAFRRPAPWPTNPLTCPPTGPSPVALPHSEIIKAHHESFWMTHWIHEYPSTYVFRSCRKRARFVLSSSDRYLASMRSAMARNDSHRVWKSWHQLPIRSLFTLFSHSDCTAICSLTLTPQNESQGTPQSSERRGCCNQWLIITIVVTSWATVIGCGLRCSMSDSMFGNFLSLLLFLSF